MTTRTKIGVALGALALGALVLGGGWAMAAGRGPGGPDGPGRPGARGGEGRMLRWIAREVGVTDAQKAEIRTVMERHRSDAAMADAAKAARLAQRAARHTIQDPDASEAEVKAALQKAAQAHEVLALKRHAAAKDVMAVLTPEQRAKAKALRDDFEAEADRRAEWGRKMFGERRHGRGPGGRGFGPGRGDGPGPGGPGGPPFDDDEF